MGIRDLLQVLAATALVLLIVGCQVPAATAPSAASPTTEDKPAGVPGQVSVTASGSGYARGEAISITVHNGMEGPVWYAQQLDCGGPFLELETCLGAPVKFYVPCMWVAPDHRFTELEPGGELVGEWDGMIGGIEDTQPAKAGCYRVVVPFVTEQPDLKLQDWHQKQTIATSGNIRVR